MTAHARIVDRMFGDLLGVVGRVDLDEALADVPTVELAALLAERWATSPSQHAFVRMPAAEPAAPAPGFTLVYRNDAGPIPGTTTAPFADWRDAKGAAILRNRRLRPGPARWWVVADGAGIPLDPQP